MLGHDKYSCDHLIRHILAAEQIRKHPTIKDRIFKKCKDMTRGHRKNVSVFQNNDESWKNKANEDDMCYSFMQDIINYDDEDNSDTDQN